MFALTWNSATKTIKIVKISGCGHFDTVAAALACGETWKTQHVGKGQITIIDTTA